MNTQTMKQMNDQIETELPAMTWHKKDLGVITHYTGQGTSWTVNLVRMGSQCMATASSHVPGVGTTIVKLTPQLLDLAESLALGKTL